MLVREGDEVEAGQVLLKLDGLQLQAEVDEAQKEYQARQDELEKLQEQREDLLGKLNDQRRSLGHPNALSPQVWPPKLKFSFE